MAIVNISINGKQYTADTNKTLLDNILENGIYLPHLCHNKELESYGGCGLCLVMVEGVKKPLRACSTTVSEGMCVVTSTPELEQSRQATLSLIMSDHGGDCKAPCFMACPTHQDIQGYVGLIANGYEREALELIKQDNPLPSSIGRVCPHPCEEKCRRKYVDEPVSICALKRFSADSHKDFVPKCDKPNGKTVAVVGAGPAGLSCAYFLALRGYGVKVFEAQPMAGGMLRYGIPAYRLPKNIIDEEIHCIEKMGVQFFYNKKLGVDYTIDSLKADFDAVFVGVGAWASIGLGCAGDSAQGVVGGIDMLYRVARGEKVELGNNVCVVGGGNTAIDAVRTAVRLGAENVTLIYRRTEKEMPAEAEEIRDARDEGVQFKFLASPAEILSQDGRVTGVILQNMELGEPDASGRRSPVPVEGSTEVVPCSTVIAAIGQRVVVQGLEPLELTRKATISVDEKSYMTSVEGVFAAGDAINKGPDIAIRAVAGGKYAAFAIDSYLKGEAFKPQLPDYSVNKGFDASVLAGTTKQGRVEVELKPAKERKNNFSEVAFTLDREEAIKEASRCLECGCASVYSCQLLPLARDYKAFDNKLIGITRQYPKDKSHPFIVRDNSKCILCGQCVRACKELSETENLGLFGRGFGTLPQTAFELPLSESCCASCGVCVNVCPTGALTSRVPAAKNPPLPFVDEAFVCTLCENRCCFTKRSINGRAVKMLPESLARCCSLGIFLEPVKQNIATDATDAQKAELKKRLLGSLQLYKGGDLEDFSLDQILEM